MSRDCWDWNSYLPAANMFYLPKFFLLNQIVICKIVIRNIILKHLPSRSWEHRELLIYHLEVSQGQAFLSFPWSQVLRTQPTTQEVLNKYFLSEWMDGGWGKMKPVFLSCLWLLQEKGRMALTLGDKQQLLEKGGERRMGWTEDGGCRRQEDKGKI